MYLKISNLMDGNRADYKGLDITDFVSGTQYYYPDYSVCLVKTNQESIPQHPNIEVITEEQYKQLKDENSQVYTPSLPEQRIEILEQENNELKNRITLVQEALDDIILNGGTL